MSNIWGPVDPVQQNQINGEGALDALQLTQFKGEVEHAYMTTTVFEDYFTRKTTITGTNKVMKKAVGRTQLQKLTPGQAPQGKKVKLGKAEVTVDTMVLSRHHLAELETIQTDIDLRSEIATQAGKDIGNHNDMTYAIAASKAAAATVNPYGLKEEDGFFGGNQVTIAAGDELDPSKLLHAIGQLVLKFRLKNVEPTAENIILVVRPEQHAVLQDAEVLVNTNYLTSKGTTLEGVPHFKTHGIPCLSSNNIPRGIVEGHLLSNDDNGMFYDGDFTKLVALAFGPKAIIIGESKPLETKIWYSDESKVWNIDAWYSYGIGIDRPEHAGRIDIA